MNMNTKLRAIQHSIREALDDDSVTAGEISQIVQETLKMESDKARTLSTKADTTLEALCRPLSAFSPLENNFSLGSYYPQAAQMINDGILGAAGQDTISF